MDTYEVVRDALGILCAGMPATNDQVVTAHCNSLTASYRVLGELPAGVNYGDPLARLAYLYKYVGANAHFLGQILATAQGQSQQPLLSTPFVKVACLGGGPGTDIIGVRKHMLDHGYGAQAVLQGCVFDRQVGWGNELMAVAAALGAPVQPFFQQIDATQAMPALVQGQISTADVITISYLASELTQFNGAGGVTQFFHDSFAAARSGAIIVFVDNSGQHTTFFDALCAQAGLQMISTSGANAVRMFSFEANIGAIAPYQLRFAHAHKRKSDYIGYRVLRKP